jgi:2-polyprenyl-3-methyl-5-hydroxy-6-metoxy-1,4-benzoquinol methylase
MNPRPTQAELDAFYQGDEYHRTRPGSPIHIIDASERRRAKRIIKEIKGGRTFLDVGCARGALLQEAMFQGYNIMGVEINPDWPMPGMPVAHSLDEIDMTYEVIACIHTLEHVIDFMGLAKALKKRLAPGGQIIIEVPSRQSAGHFNDCHLYLLPASVLRELFAPLTCKVEKLTPHLFMRFEEG